MKKEHERDSSEHVMYHQQLQSVSNRDWFGIICNIKHSFKPKQELTIQVDRRLNTQLMNILLTEHTRVRLSAVILTDRDLSFNSLFMAIMPAPARRCQRYSRGPAP